jgi:bifunctional DNase/RNase
MVLMKIRGLDQCVKAEGSALVLEFGEGEELHVILTVEETHRIAHELQIEDEFPTCPCFRNSVCSLVAFMVSHGDVGIASIVLSPSGDNRLAASVQVRTGPVETSVPCRTADALALAIRLRVPVFATATLAQIIEREGTCGGKDPLPDEGEAAPWLDGVKPDDFVR